MHVFVSITSNNGLNSRLDRPFKSPWKIRLPGSGRADRCRFMERKRNRATLNYESVMFIHKRDRVLISARFVTEGIFGAVRGNRSLHLPG